MQSTSISNFLSPPPVFFVPLFLNATVTQCGKIHRVIRDTTCAGAEQTAHQVPLIQGSQKSKGESGAVGVVDDIPGLTLPPVLRPL